MGLRKREYIHEETLITAENLNDIQDAVIALEDGLFSVDDTKSGEVITITDAYKRGFRSLSIYGKTTQDGTPTPDNPVDLVNIGDSGSITVNVSGKNEEQSVTIATPNGLPGIPVPSGGNYTDANGQQWICDEIDFARGVYIRRIEALSLAVASMNNSDGFPGWKNVGISRYYPNCNGYIGNFGAVSMCNISGNPNGAIHINTLNGNDVLLIPGYNATTQSQWIAQYPNLVVEIIYSIPTPIETILSADELAAYSALHTYRDNTTVTNDASAHMELEYVMDSKKYIDSKIASSILTATVE